MQTRTDPNTLYHSGKKGMKWGVRRYQNKDGTLTEAGKKRYARDIREDNAKKKENRAKVVEADPDRWVKEDISRAKKVTDESRNAVKEIQNIEKQIPSKKRQKLDLSNMSDKELRSAIDRHNLEQRYNDIYNPQTVSRGRDYFNKALAGTTTALAVTGSALGIALAIKELSS